MSKVQSHHLERPAYVYVRQSTMGQVRHHRESTERQYDLRNRAVEMMWPPGRIRILDQDLGQSGAQTTTREDFKTLVADVSLGRVGGDLRPGSVAVGAFEPRMASADRDLRADPDAGHRRGRLLRPRRFQRRPVVGDQGHHRPGRAARHSRAPPGRQASQGTKG